MFDPLKAALGNYLADFYRQVVPTTAPLGEFVKRGVSRSVIRCPARLVDAATDMLDQWQRRDEGVPSNPADLPVIIFGIAKDYTPTGRDYTRQVADRVLVIIPEDPKARAFGLRSIAGDIRAQVVFFARDEGTARSLAAQFLLYLDTTEGRRFDALYTFAGFALPWPVQIESPDAPAMNIATDAKNLTILAVDITLKATVPLFDAPAEGEANDGKGTPGTDDPAGYPLVEEVVKYSYAAPASAEVVEDIRDNAEPEDP